MDVSESAVTSNDALANVPTRERLCVLFALLCLTQERVSASYHGFHACSSPYSISVEDVATSTDAAPKEAEIGNAEEASEHELYETFALLLRSELLGQEGGNNPIKDDAPPHGVPLGVAVLRNDVRNETRLSGVMETEVPDPAGLVLLSWPPTIGCPYEARIDRSDIVYQIYEDCLLSLQKEYPVSTWSSATVEEASKRPAMQRHPPSGTLVNLLADHSMQKRLRGSPPAPTTRPLESMPDFILYGIEAVSNSPGVTGALGSPPSNHVESDLYQAFLLHIFGRWVDEECRARLMAEWSPMYWSRASRMEILDRTYGSGLWSQPLHTFSNDEFVDFCADNNSVETFGSFVGYPIDIPWFSAPHDDYPYSGIWSMYTTIRSEPPRSFQADFALWVSAMTFGVLEAVIRMKIPEAVLVDAGAGEGTPVLSGRRILQLLTFWYHRFHLSKEHAPGDHGPEVARILRRAFDALDEEVHPPNGIFGRAGLHDTESFRTTICAIGSTLLSLCIVSAAHCWSTVPEMHEVFYLAQRPRLFTTQMLLVYGGKMTDAGWCPTVPPALLSTTSMILPSSSYLIQLPPLIRSTREEHRDCTSLACTLYTITNTAAYVPRHVDPSCHCEYTRPSLDDVMGLLSDGVIPAVVFDGSGLRVQPAEHGSYVAISHVWADGMGSTTDIGLPTCVVKRISGLAKTLLPSGAFWMDSLSVPRHKELRKKAIKLMAHTYRDAAKVLVIDGVIRAQCSRTKTWQENLVRIATSGWVRRVWTLQEAVLARELHFEFVEGPVNVEEDLQLKYWSRWHGSVYGCEARDAFRDAPVVSWTKQLAPLLRVRAMRSGTDGKMSLGAVIELLFRRTSTESKDEIVAIASLLTIGLDLDALLALDGPDAAQERMRMFLLQLRRVPKCLPMIETERLTLPGFRWAPRTLASWGVTESEYTQHVWGDAGVCSEEGLLAEYWVGLLDKPLPLLPLDATPRDPSSIGRGDLPFLAAYIGYSPPGSMKTTYHGVTYRGSWISGYPSPEPQPIDTLLFLRDEDMSAGISFVCVAARTVDARSRYVGRDDAPADNARTAIGSPQNPMRLRYVALPNLFHIPVGSAEDFDRLSMQGTRMGELRKVWVQLE